MAKSSNNYSILVGVQLETKNIQSQLNAISKNLKFTLNMDASGAKTLTGAVTTTNTALKETQQVASNTSKQVNTLGKNMSNTGKSAEDTMLTFQAANAIFRQTIEVITSMIEQVFELNTAMIEFQKVSDLSGEALEEYVANLSAVGNTVGRTGSEMVDAAT